MYDKIIVTRSTPEIAESIGFLPGTEVFLIYVPYQKFDHSFKYAA
jgi:PhoH-like ATPase